LAGPINLLPRVADAEVLVLDVVSVELPLVEVFFVE
jgi:hypothetical protein